MPGTGKHGRSGFKSHEASGPVEEADMSDEGQVQEHGNLKLVSS